MNKCFWGNVCEGEGGDKVRVRNAKLRGLVVVILGVESRRVEWESDLRFREDYFSKVCVMNWMWVEMGGRILMLS